MADPKAAAKFIADHVDSPAWEIADFLAAEFPAPEGDAQRITLPKDGVNTGLHDELEAVAKELRSEYGIVYKTNTLRARRATALTYPPGTRRDVSYAVHERCRGEGGPAKLDKWIRHHQRMSDTRLSQHQLARYIADENRAKKATEPPESIHDHMFKKVRSAAFAKLVGPGQLSGTKDKDHWWRDGRISNERLGELIEALRDIADQIDEDRE